MAKVVGDIAVRVGADVAPLQRGMSAAGRSVGDFNRSAEQMAVRFARVGTRVALAATAMGVAISAATLKVVRDLDSIANQADKIGLSTDALQELRFAATLAGVETTTLDMAMQRFTRRVAEARQGTGEAKAALEEMGISLRDNFGNARDINDVLADVADAMQAMTDESDRVRIAMKLFDSEGVSLVNMLSSGASALEDVRTRARDLGIVLEEDLLRTASDLNDEFTETTAQLDAEFKRLMIELGPLVVSLASSLATAAGAMGELANAAGIAMGKLNPLLNDLREFMGMEFDPGAVASGVRPAGDDQIVGGGDPSNTGLYVVDPVTGAIMTPDQLMAVEKERWISGANLRAEAMRLMTQDGAYVTPDAPDGSAPTGSGGGGSGGGGLVIGPTEADMAAMEARFQTARERVMAQYEEDLAQLAQFRASKVATEEEYNDLEARIHADHQERLAEIDGRAKQARLQAVAGMFGDLSSLMSTENEKLFKIGQAAAIAEAVVSGYQSAVDAWQKGMKIGGPPLAAAFSAASLAKTGALISGIASQKIGGGASQSAGAGAGVSGVGAGAAQQAPAAPAQQKSLTLIGDSFNMSQAVAMAEFLNDAGEDGLIIRGGAA